MITKKEFQEILNKEDLNSKIKTSEGTGFGNKGKYKPTKRLYGDYLRSQDPWMFENAYNDYLQKIK